MLPMRLLALKHSRRHAPLAYDHQPTEGSAGWAYHDTPRAVCFFSNTPRPMHDQARYISQLRLPYKKPDQVEGRDKSECLVNRGGENNSAIS